MRYRLVIIRSGLPEKGRGDKTGNCHELQLGKAGRRRARVANNLTSKTVFSRFFTAQSRCSRETAAYAAGLEDNISDSRIVGCPEFTIETGSPVEMLIHSVSKDPRISAIPFATFLDADRQGCLDSVALACIKKIRFAENPDQNTLVCCNGVLVSAIMNRLIMETRYISTEIIRDVLNASLDQCQGYELDVTLNQTNITAHWIKTLRPT